MKPILAGLKRLSRPCLSLGQAITTKLAAICNRRGPSRTCQVPGLRELLKQHLPNLHQGTFVEVGAYDGERFSNTSWLADNGWQGIYVEPSAEFARLCRIRHCLNNVQVLNVAAGEAEGEATLMQIGSLSTMSGQTFDEYQQIPWAKGQIEKGLEHHATAIQPLNTLLTNSQCPAEFELLVVDVEGFEESVFRGFDLDRWQPRILIVELCDMHADFRDNVELVASARRVRERIHTAGYCEIYCDNINTVFARNSATSLHAADHQAAPTEPAARKAA